jgi:hypothetical protein
MVSWSGSGRTTSGSAVDDHVIAQGRAVVSNAAAQILLRQAPQAMDLVAGAFRLSAGDPESLAKLEAEERNSGVDPL